MPTEESLVGAAQSVELTPSSFVSFKFFVTRSCVTELRRFKTKHEKNVGAEMLVSFNVLF
jgi:rRNA-processing protein FCF1